MLSNPKVKINRLCHYFTQARRHCAPSACALIGGQFMVYLLANRFLVCGCWYAFAWASGLRKI